MRMLRVASLFGACVLASGCTVADDESLSTTSQAVMDDEMSMGCPGPSPIMQVGDFDGDGRVRAADLHALLHVIAERDYAAFYDMNADGKLDWRDIAIVASNLGRPGTARDRQMAALWNATSPYRNIANAQAAGYIPFTPDLMGHGIHFANFNLIYSWAARSNDGGSYHFHPEQPEGLNYTADGRLVAAFYYEPGAVDLSTLDPSKPPYTYYKSLPVMPSFDGVMADEWHHHIGACFGGATSPVPGFDQCMTKPACDAAGGTLWSPGFHMLHVWLFEYNACGPFAGIDEDISPMAPMEPHHGECTISDVVPVLIP